MKNKLNKKLQFSLYGVGALIVGICVIFLVTYFVNRNILTVSFYGLDDKTRVAIEQIITDTTVANNSNASFEFINLDITLPLDVQVGKADIVFTLAGKNAETLIESSVGIPADLFNNFPQSIGSAGKKENIAFAVPIVLNHFEISYNMDILRNYNGGTPLRTFPQLEGFADYVQKNAPKTGYPFAIAGGDDTTLLLFLSALIESYYGKDAYMNFVDILNATPVQSNEDFLELVQMPLRNTEDEQSASNIDNLFSVVRAWQLHKYIHREWMHLTEKDILTFIELERPSVVFMPLSFHRTVPFREIRHYTTSWFPAGQSSLSRSLIIPAVLGIPLSDKTVNAASDTEKPVDTLSILADLASNSTQGSLSDATEFAPVHSRSQTLDKQASDLRLWAAASDSLLPSIEQSAFLTSTEVSVFCEFFREWLDR